MLILDATVCAAFFAGGLITGAVAAIAIAFTSWCYDWPRGVWK
ncbi:MAG TPA: hypothetical protein VEZ59_06400 [Sphingopyxis sp.]|nr:hypothetical protein [Sphingopyxis sp.]